MMFASLRREDCRLFSIVSLSAVSGPVARLVQRFAIFRRHPALIHLRSLQFGFRIVNGLHRRALLVADICKSRRTPPPADPPAVDTGAETASGELFQIQ
jgi:hypothetical protein